MALWKESLCVFLEQNSHTHLTPKQQHAFKPKACFALIRNPFLQEIRRVLIHIEPLA